MAITTGDLYPRVSGSASLGVEQLGFCGFTTDIRPFAHVHANSGVYHGIHGGSGIIRYNKGTLEKSNDGGITFASFGGTLQEAYNAGQSIVAEYPGNGPVSINGSSSWGLSLSQIEGEFPHLLVSGVNDQVLGGGDIVGSMWLQAHTAGGPAQRGSTSITSRAQASAKSLGIDTWFMTTGSGVVSVRVASGVSQFISLANSANIDANGLIVPLHFQTIPNTFYGVSASSGIQIYVPGQYKIHYSAVIEKQTGNLSQMINTELRFYDRWGQSFRFLGSESAAIVRDSSTLKGNTCNSQTLIDLHSGDSLVLFAWHEGTPPAGNTSQTKTRATNVLVEWIGPLAGTGLIKQKVT